MRTIEINGLKIVLGEGVDVEIQGDTVRISAKPAERVEHHYHHTREIVTQPLTWPQPPQLPISPFWEIPRPTITGGFGCATYSGPPIVSIQQ